MNFSTSRNILKNERALINGKREKLHPEIEWSQKRYQNLLMTYLFKEYNNLWKGAFNHAQPTGKNNWKQELLERYKQKHELNLLEDSVISYPLFAIYEEIIQNLDFYKNNNKSQAELAEKFGVSNLEILHKIIVALDLKNILNWSLVKMPTKDFLDLESELFTVTLDGKRKMNKHYQFDKEWSVSVPNDYYVNLICAIKYDNNLSNLYSWLSALGVVEQMKISNLYMRSEDFFFLRDFVSKKFGYREFKTENKVYLRWNYLKKEDVSYIVSHFLEYKRKHWQDYSLENATKRIRTFLRWNGYELEETRGNKNQKITPNK